MQVSAKTISVSRLVKLFGVQASKYAGSFGDRRLVSHLMGEIPTTKSVFHCVSVPGAELELIDGNKRVLHWMNLDQKDRPFEKVILITHEVASAAPYKVLADIAKVRQSIDSKDSVSRNVDEYLTALYTAGLKNPQSRAYQRGVKVEDLFRRVIGAPTTPFTHQMAQSHLDLHIHEFMDHLFYIAERNKIRDTYLHAGISVAIFKLIKESEKPDEVKAVIIKAYKALVSGAASHGVVAAVVRVLRTAASNEFREILCSAYDLLNKPAYHSQCAVATQRKLATAVKRHIAEVKVA